MLPATSRLVLFFALLMPLVMANPSTASHPFHTSIAEIEWNESTRRWEVGVRIFANDLQKALHAERHDSTKSQSAYFDLDLERPECVDMVQTYLARHFRLATEMELEKLEQQLPNEKTSAGLESSNKDDQGSEFPFQWVGHEYKGGWVWLYFEIAPTAPDKQFVVVRRFLSEVNEDQINSIAVRNGTQRLSLQTNAKLNWVAFDSTMKSIAPNQ